MATDKKTSMEKVCSELAEKLQNEGMLSNNDIIHMLEGDKNETKTFKIYFNDLNEDTQKRLLDFVDVKSASDMNWDMDILPIAIFEIEKEEPKWLV